VFSYMILFKLVPLEETWHTFHWTELYTIVTMSTILIEHIRQVSILRKSYAVNPSILL
jgi:hypothetical protein